MDQSKKFSSWLAILQGIFYVTTGIWPIVSPSSFQAVTGPKKDLWLVKTIGALISVIGFDFIKAGLSGQVDGQTRFLAVASPLVLGGSDIVYTKKGVLRRVYLLDAAAEAALALLWGIEAYTRRQARP